MMYTPTGRQVAALRKRLGLTQHDFAHVLGCSGSVVSRWELNRSKPSGLYSRMLLVFNLASQIPGIADRVRSWSTRGPLFTLYRLLGEVYERSDWLEQLIELQRQYAGDLQTADLPRFRNRRKERD